jgi:tetratricopeptide (TPR) repeat protein
VLVQGLVGDENETASLLHSIAEQYLGLGQRSVAIDLLRRATVHLHHSSSLSHLESLLQASIKLGAVLADDGNHEDAIKLLKEISTFKLPASRASTASHLLGIIRNVRKEAALDVSKLLTKFGRQDEAKIFEAGIAASNTES